MLQSCSEDERQIYGTENHHVFGKTKRTWHGHFDKLKLVYGGDAKSRSGVLEWANRFAEGRMDVNDDAQSGRPSIAKMDENFERVRMLV